MKAKLIAAAALLAGLGGMPPATGNTTPAQVSIQVPKEAKEQKRVQIQQEAPRVRKTRRRALTAGIHRTLNQRQRRKLERQVPQNRKK